MMLIAHLTVVSSMRGKYVHCINYYCVGILIIYATGVTAINIAILMRYCVNELLYITFYELFNRNHYLKVIEVISKKVMK